MRFKRKELALILGHDVKTIDKMMAKGMPYEARPGEGGARRSLRVSVGRIAHPPILSRYDDRQRVVGTEKRPLQGRPVVGRRSETTPRRSHALSCSVAEGISRRYPAATVQAFEYSREEGWRRGKCVDWTTSISILVTPRP